MNQLRLIVIVLLWTCLSAAVQNRHTASELVALENRFNVALVRSDWKAIDEIEADDLIFTDASGAVSGKGDEIDTIRSGAMKFDSIVMPETKVQDFGDVAVVTGKLIEKARYKTTDLSGTYRFTDVWAKRNGRWQHVAGQETLIQTAK